MDKLSPTFQATPVTTKSAEVVSGWYVTETTVGAFSPSEVGWLHAAGWKTTSYSSVNGSALYAMSRRVIKPEAVLDDLIDSYTDAYNEGRTLNDQRYDDLLVLWTAILDKTEDAYNTLETDDDTYEALIETIITQLGTDHSTYDTTVDGDLDAWGTDRLAEINAAFDARLAALKQEMVDRGTYNTTNLTTMQSGVERDRQRALNEANDLITQRRLELEHKRYEEQKTLRLNVYNARERLRNYLRAAKDRQVAVRNAVAEALGRLVEARTDSYPDLAQVGQIAASLGAGSAESYSA